MESSDKDRKTKYHHTKSSFSEEKTIECLLSNVLPLSPQTDEMREWFRAFRSQNITHRDYRRYFRPVLCYLEGAWTTAVNTIEESFSSPRHKLEAESWEDLHDKIRFTSYAGKKNQRENYAFLPQKIMSFQNSTPVLAQWNYRILCHPLKNYLHLNRLKAIDDLDTRMRYKLDAVRLHRHMATRFMFNPEDSDEWSEESLTYQFLDDLMGEIPGTDNYPASIVDDSIYGKAYSAKGNGDQVLNAGYYHRVHINKATDANGVYFRRKGFNDESVFMAKSTCPEVAPMTYTVCSGNWRRRKCNQIPERWTYAIPFELIYLTPLGSWNPYNLEHKGVPNVDPEAMFVKANGRTGDRPEKAFNGTRDDAFYRTPSEFYEYPVGKWVLDQEGVPRHVSTSGIHFFTRAIKDVGEIRMRYPVMPLHEEGRRVSRELKAVEDMVLDKELLDGMRRDTPNPHQGLTLRLSPSDGNTGSHEHFVDLTYEDLVHLGDHGMVNKLTTVDYGHQHEVTIMKPRRYGFSLLFCDKRRAKCLDGHSGLTIEE